ncbi:MAG: hypothetical protein WB579_01225 [Bryobacteraceae bacterium]
MSSAWFATATYSATDRLHSAFRLVRVTARSQFGEQLSRRVQFTDRVEPLGSFPELLPDREHFLAVIRRFCKQNPFA